MTTEKKKETSRPTNEQRKAKLLQERKQLTDRLQRNQRELNDLRNTEAHSDFS